MNSENWEGKYPFQISDSNSNMIQGTVKYERGHFSAALFSCFCSKSAKRHDAYFRCVGLYQETENCVLIRWFDD